MKHVLFCIFLTFSLTNSAIATAISKDSENLAWCEGVYLYYAQGMQIRNNEGAAKNLLFRASRVTTANMFMNLKDGVVSGDVIGQWKAARSRLKAKFDADPDKWMAELNKCDTSTKSVIQSIRDRRIIFDKKTFDEFQGGIFATYRNSLGIQ